MELFENFFVQVYHFVDAALIFQLQKEFGWLRSQHQARENNDITSHVRILIQSTVLYIQPIKINAHAQKNICAQRQGPAEKDPYTKIRGNQTPRLQVLIESMKKPSS